MYLLDTNVVSELRKIRLGKADPYVVLWTSSVDASNLFISTITAMELEVGILQMSRRDRQQGLILRRWLETVVLPEFNGRTLAVDIAVARTCAPLHVPNPKSDRDALIAATALVHRMTVVTRNVADFAATGVPLLNPWDAA